MPEYKTYIARKRARFNAACGPVDIPYGTELTAEGKFICMDGQSLCEADSQTALDFFCQNDDGQGQDRATLINTILTRLDKQDGWSRKRWNEIWADALCQKYKRPEHTDHWIWNPAFFNAPIPDLRHIAALIDGALK